MNLRKITRVSIAYGLYATGLLSLIARFRLHKKAVILMYHRVLTDEEYSRSFFMNGIAVRSRTFEKQMNFLTRNFHILSPEELLFHIRKGTPFESKSCMVTFDDGWKDNFKNAFPTLIENKIPALIFLSTGFVDSRRRFWQERLIESLCSLRCQSGRDPGKIAETLPTMKSEGIAKVIYSDEAAFQEEVLLFTASQKKEKTSRIEEMISLLNQNIEPQKDGNPKDETFLNWQEIGVMAKDGIRFGSHGVNHQILPQIEKEEVEKEASESKELLESKLGKEVWAFSYPNGDYNEEALSAVRKCGYQAAFTTETGAVASTEDPYRLKRQNIHEDMTDSIPMFLARIAGLW